jgi:mannose-6-phosphate isomerase-like protein (cupin superfamily)
MMLTHRHQSAAADAIAPDGSEVRLLVQGARGSMAHFTLPPGAVSKPVAHHTVEEVWLVLSGEGRMWRKLGAEEQILDLKPGLSLVIPVGARFQFRNDGTDPLECLGVTMPPWPGMDEAYEVDGVW